MTGKYGRSRLHYKTRGAQPVPKRDRPKCLHCHRALAPDYMYLEFNHTPAGDTEIVRSLYGYGYDGNGRFCSLRCGYRYALNVTSNVW